MQEIDKLFAGQSGEKILIGDMNIDMKKPTDRDVNMYANTMTSLGLTLCNDKITCESSNAVLDHVYTNMETNRKVHTATVKCHFSDYNVLITSFESRAIATAESTISKKIDYERLASIVLKKISEVPHVANPSVLMMLYVIYYNRPSYKQPRQTQGKR